MLLLVAADDRTGALETAGALADGGVGPVAVHAWAISSRTDAPVSVVDLGTRHADPARAGELAAAVDGVPADRHAHKIDSTLRGNWASELVARSGRPVLLVPALPALGRTCRDGVVLVDGVPVHETASGSDVTGDLASSRPSQLLERAGATDVHAIGDVDGLWEWLRAPRGIAVHDASTAGDIARITASWAVGPPEVLLAGTSAVVGAAGVHVLHARRPATEPPPLRRPVLVVAGSVHPSARAQVAQVQEAGTLVTTEVDDVLVGRLAAGETVVLRAPDPARTITPESAHTTVVRLGAQFGEIADRVELGTIVVLGGDTAAAVLGARTVEVGGTLADGVPWGRVEGGGPLVVTRSGGFGGPGALVALLSGTLAP